MRSVVPTLALRALVASLAAFALGVGACSQGASPPASSRSPLLGQPAPELQQATLDGATARLSSFRGRLVVVDFFADYCAPCRRTLPDLQALADARSDVAVVGVAEDAQPEVALALIRQLNLAFPVVFDREHVLAGRYRVGELPATFVLDRNGRVRWKTDHACERAELEAVLDSLR